MKWGAILGAVVGIPTVGIVAGIMGGGLMLFLGGAALGTVHALTGMASITTDDQDRAVLTASAIMQMEGEGLQDIRDYYRAKMVRMGVIKPTDEEIQQMQAEKNGQQPDPQSAYLLASAEQAQADAAQARAKTVQTIADAELKKLKLMWNCGICG